MCCLSNEMEPGSHFKLGFKFYDYDENKNIGSVDIVNLMKFLPS
jgi:hypothetical protein